MDKMKIPLFKVHMPDTVMDPVREVLFSGFINEGIQVTEFEKQLKCRIGNPFTIATNSCASSLTIALNIAGVCPCAEVIASPMTCVATNTPIKNLFAKPVWCDINSKTGNIDPEKIEEKITEKTKAILFVDWAGIPADLDKIKAIGKKHNLKVIEDAAQAFGAKYKGKNIGGVSDLTCFSFQAIKHITTGDGGALSFLREDDYDRGRKLKWFGIDREASKDAAGNWRGNRWGCDIVEAGYKMHMNNLEAAIGIEQLKCVDYIIKKHCENAKFYLDNLKGIRGITLPEIDSGVEPVWWVFMLFAQRRDDLSKKLSEFGVHSSLLHVRNDLYECFKDSKIDLPEVTKFQEHELCIPCGWWLTPEDREYVVNVIKKGW